MAEFIFLMHDDSETHDVSWEPYLTKLNQSGAFNAGSAIGDGVCVNKIGEAVPVTAHLVGYIRVTADNIAHAKSLLAGNPVYEAGGTVEIRELPRTD
ncbi:MAG: hypothetical protein ACXWKC_02840 [Xanthobacteraceae bacterium]